MDAVYKRILMERESLIHAELENMGEHGLCYSALLYAAQNNAAEARKVLRQVDEKHKDHSCSLVLEANALIYYAEREFNAARDFALRAVTENLQSVFAQSTLARLAIFEKRYAEALQCYQKILEAYPENKGILLDMAETYFLNKNFGEAKRYIDMAKPSARKTLYKFFLSFNSFKTRFVWMLLVLASVANPYVLFVLYILTTAAFLYVFVRFGYKKGDTLIARRSLYIQAVHTVLFALAGCVWVGILLEGTG
jgi:tetratricopeptide (TPR) repeat protein